MTPDPAITAYALSTERWAELVKRLRTENGLTLFEAERHALRSPVLRRWAERRINQDRKCRLQALAHIRINGARSLIEAAPDGGGLRFVATTAGNPAFP